MLKRFWSRYIGNLFFRPRFYVLVITASALFLFRYFLVWLGDIPFDFAGVVLMLFLSEYFLLFSKKKMFFARRALAENRSFAPP